MKSKCLAECLVGHNVLLVTNLETEFGDKLFYNSYGPLVVDQYFEALKDLGAEVTVSNLDAAFKLFSQAGQTGKPDWVVNVCVGFNALESENIIQAIAALSYIPCFPCRGDIAIIAEEKIISKHLAQQAGFRTPQTIRNPVELSNREIYVKKRINSGDSKHIKLITSEHQLETIKQGEFVEPYISGSDVELFCLFDAKKNEHVILSAKALNIGNTGTNPFLHESSMKSSSDDYNPSQKMQLKWSEVSTTEAVCDAVKRLGSLFHDSFIFRIDGRVTGLLGPDVQISLDNFVFLEVNTMPTIPGDGGWFAPSLLRIANTNENDLSLFTNLSSGQIALRLLMLAWSRIYVQSKSDDGNIPVL